MRTESELQIVLLETICGKDGATKAKAFIRKAAAEDQELFPILNLLTEEEVSSLMKSSGIGFPKVNSKAICQIAGQWQYNMLDLAKIKVSELEAIKGIGAVAARTFVLAARPKEEHVILNDQILAHLREHGIPCPADVPNKGSTYDRLEGEMIILAKNRGKDVADYAAEITAGCNA